MLLVVFVEIYGGTIYSHRFGKFLKSVVASLKAYAVICDGCLKIAKHGVVICLSGLDEQDICHQSILLMKS